MEKICWSIFLYIYMYDSNHCCTAEINILNQLYLNKMRKKSVPDRYSFVLHKKLPLPVGWRVHLPTPGVWADPVTWSDPHHVAEVLVFQCWGKASRALQGSLPPGSQEETWANLLVVRYQVEERPAAHGKASQGQPTASWPWTAALQACEQ